MRKHEYFKTTGISSLKFHLKNTHKMTFKSSDEPVEKRANKESNERLLNWVVDANVAFRMVERKSFIKFCESLDPTYQLPVRQTVSSLVEKRSINYDQEKIDYLKKLRGKIHCTSDIWTQNSYFSVTVHFIDNDFNLKYFLLEHVPVEEPHDNTQKNRVWKSVQKVLVLSF
jgi:hypothetical protein